MYSRLSDVGKKLKKLAAQLSFKAFKIFHENLVAVEQVKVELTLNRPIYVWFAILDLSKMLMYDFHYNYIKRKYTDFLKYARSMKFSLPISIYSIFFGRKKKGHSIMWKQRSNRQNEGRVERGNYWTAGRFESENVFIEN